MDPFALEFLDESFCIDVGSGGVGPGAFGCQPQYLTSQPRGLRAVRTAVIRE